MGDWSFADGGIGTYWRQAEMMLRDSVNDAERGCPPDGIALLKKSKVTTWRVLMRFRRNIFRN